LALDTVVRQFAKVYTKAALSRVADAYELSTVKRKLVHDTRLGAEESVDSVMPVQPEPKGSDPLSKKGLTSSVKPVAAMSVGTGSDLPIGQAGPTAKTTMGLTPSRGGAVEFRMERGAGRERTFIARAGTKASASKVWEILTGY